MLKRIGLNSTEGTTLKYLNSRSDPNNHTVPLLGIVRGNMYDGDCDFLVMPLLRPFDDPPFVYVEEVVDFVRQTLQVCSPVSHSYC